MDIKILGNGGAINEGLPYNSFLINSSLLCELPPDIMPSLNSNSIKIQTISKVFISHFHGDHIFGLPFFILSLFYEFMVTKKFNGLTIYGPGGIQEKSRELVISAFTENHPCLQWMIVNINFQEIPGNNISLLKEYSTIFITLEHLVPTYGFALKNNNSKIEFAYISDSLWNEEIEKIIKEKPKAVIIDLNGMDDDPVKIHISIDDVIKKGLPISRTHTTYYGTHLKNEFSGSNEFIQCSTPGMEIKI